LIQTTTTTTIQRLIVLLHTHYKSIWLSIIFFIDLLKYNYLSRSEGQAKMVHSLFRSNACYFSFYQQTHFCYLLRHNSFIPKNYYIHHQAHHHLHCNLTLTTPIVSCYYFLTYFIFILYENEIPRPHTYHYCYYYCFQ